MNRPLSAMSESVPTLAAAPTSFSRPIDVSRDDTFDVPHFLRLLRRRIWLIASLCVLLTALVGLVVVQLAPSFTAETLVMLERGEQKVVDIEAVLSGSPTDSETVQSEVEVLRSRNLVRRVVEKLALSENPEFNPSLRPPGLAEGLLDFQAWMPESVYSVVFTGVANELSDGATEQEREAINVVDVFLERLSVQARRNSRVISISFKSGEPRLAAEVTNELADLYLVQQLEAKYEATRRATSWLNTRLADMKIRVERAEQSVEAFRSQAGLVRGSTATVASQQITELNTELVLSRTKRAQAQARLRQVERLVSSANGVDSAAEVLASPLIQKLQEQLAEILGKRAELATEFGEKHPRMIQVRAEAKDLQRKIEREVKKVVQSLRNEVGVARAGEQTLQASMNQLESRAAGLSGKEVKLRALEREASAERALYETFLSRFKETGAQEDLQQTDARIISKADIPIKPSFPKPLLIIGSAFIASLLLGISLVLLLEQLDRGYRSMDELERLGGIRPLGLVPEVSGILKAPEQVIVDRPVSAYAEAIRTLHTSLAYSMNQEAPKTLLLTSAMPKEGKSTIAISLARLTARAGLRVALIDGDLRRPTLNRRTKLPRSPGLVEFLQHEVELSEILIRDPQTEAIIIPSGRETDQASELLASPRMGMMMKELNKVFDLVIIDSPPILAVADTRILARLADQTVYVIRWARTRREVADEGIRQLREGGVPLAGAVLSAVNVRAHAQYGYGDSGYYYGTSTRYYGG
jgi:polysaccharide biosynthesis transport protein